jgi:hypothetical protein
VGFLADYSKEDFKDEKQKENGRWMIQDYREYVMKKMEPNT